VPDPAAAVLIKEGRRMDRPKKYIGPVMPEIWWEITQRCLSPRAQDRPSMQELLEVMSVLKFKCATRTSSLSRRLAIAGRDDLAFPFQLSVTRSCQYTVDLCGKHALIEKQQISLPRKMQMGCPSPRVTLCT
jgi:hypothetical protein